MNESMIAACILYLVDKQQPIEVSSQRGVAKFYYQNQQSKLKVEFIDMLLININNNSDNNNNDNSNKSAGSKNYLLLIRRFSTFYFHYQSPISISLFDALDFNVTFLAQKSCFYLFAPLLM